MSEYLEKPAYIRGQILPLKDANVNIQTHALQYGTAAFGGIRGYYQEEAGNLYLFRLEDHYNRLKASAHILQMKIPLTFPEFQDVILKMLREGNWKQDVYLRPFLYKADLALSPRLHNVSDDLAIYAIPLNDYLDTKRGQKTMVSSYVRISDNQIPTRSKASGGYINSALAKSEALENGYDEAIFLDIHGFVSEGSAENIFLVKNGELITPDTTSSILEGITRRSILQLARDARIPTVERKISRTELYTADEAFFSGTGAQVAWIVSVDRRTIGNGEIGPVTKILQDKYFRIVRGLEQSYFEWLTPVY